MMRADRLLRLFPRAWRDRYGEEFLATVGPGPLHVQQVIDIVSGAIDAWLSADVRRATVAPGVAGSEGGSMLLKSLMACEQKLTRVTILDGLIGAGVMIAGSFLLKMLGVAAGRAGWPTTSKTLMEFWFLGSFTLSMPFWLMKGQPWKAQLAIVGGTLMMLIAIGLLG